MTDATTAASAALPEFCPHSTQDYEVHAKATFCTACRCYVDGGSRPIERSYSGSDRRLNEVKVERDAWRALAESAQAALDKGQANLRNDSERSESIAALTIFDVAINIARSTVEWDAAELFAERLAGALGIIYQGPGRTHEAAPCARVPYDPVARKSSHGPTRKEVPTMGEVVDVEEDDMGDAWCVAPTEACSFVALAVFPNKKDAERFVALLRASRKRSNTYDDLAVLPARAHVLCANSYDVKAGRIALAKAAPAPGATSGNASSKQAP